MKQIYLDYAATTYIDERVLKVMQPFLSRDFGNPSSIYNSGMNAKFAIDDARKSIAVSLNCKETEIIFTAGGTESVNLAIFGVVRKALLNAKRKPHIICSAIEHHAVLESFKALEAEGVETTCLPVNQQGFVDSKALQKAIKPNTVLVSIIYANNEIGTIQLIPEISRTLRKVNEERFKAKLNKIYFHTDACQALGALSVDVQKLGVDLLSFNGSKVYGPKQTGGLFVRFGTKLNPLIYGGGQENGFRSGTENVAGVVGLAKAISIANAEMTKENKRLRSLRDYFIQSLEKKIEDVTLTGASIKEDSEKYPKRLPNNINFIINGAEGEALLLYLDARGVEISTGSACASTSLDPSHVIKALGYNESQAKSAIRVSLGRKTKKADLAFLLKIIPGIVKELRRVSQLS